MLISANGKVLARSKHKAALARAEEVVLDFIRTDAWFCYKYQVHWLRACHWEQLGNDLSGYLFVGYPVLSAGDAANILLRKAGYKLSQVKVPNRKMPLTESTVRFKRLTLSFLPKGRPCLMERNSLPVFLPELARIHGLSLPGAAAKLIHLISEE